MERSRSPAGTDAHWGMQNFRELDVWVKAHAFTQRIRKVVRTFPDRGFSELRSQMLRAAESIPTNIVEGCGAATRKEFARFLDISIKSCSEVEYQIQLIFDYGLISAAAWQSLTDDVTEVRKMLYGLRRAILAKA